MIGAKRRMAARALAMGAMAAGVLAAGALAGSVPGMAQSPSLSDESVLKLMEYAWQQTPPRFTKPDAKVVEIDKKKPEAARVPVDVAREVIIAARRTALAQICKLEEHQLANYRSLMYREAAKKKWSEQQMVYINMLHLTTMQIYAGDITIKVKDDGGKVVEETPAGNKRAQSCTEAEAAKLKEQIETYIAQGPVPIEKEPSTASAAPKAPAATGSTTPPAGDKKK